MTLGWILAHNTSEYAESRKDVPFCGPTDGEPRLRGQTSHKPAKGPSMHVRASANKMKMKEIIEE